LNKNRKIKNIRISHMNHETNIEKEKEKEKCISCKKKLKLISFDCQCGVKGLCTRCKDPSEHKCTANYQKINQDILRKHNPVVIADKMVKC